MTRELSSTQSRLNDMDLDNLRKDYKGAFDDWATEVNRLRAITDTESPDLKAAEERVAAAEIAYRDTRDRLTDDMVESQSRG